MHKSERKPYDPAKFGAMMRQHRRELGWTQRQLAHELHITNTYVSQFERGRVVEITVTFLDRLRAVFNMTWDQIIDEGGVDVGAVPAVPKRRRRVLQRLEKIAEPLSMAQIEQLIGFAEVLKRSGTPGDAANQAPTTEAPGALMRRGQRDRGGAEGVG